MQISKVKDENDLFDFSKVKERLVMTCVPADNEYVKHGAATRIIGDIAIIYRIIIESEDDEVISAAIRENMLKVFGITEEELFSAALQSSQKLLPAVSMRFDELLHHPAEETLGENFYVVSNSEVVFGASAIFYPDVLSDIAEKTGCNELFIIPSSRDECIVCGNDGTVDMKELHNHLIEKNGNPQIVPEDKYLSDSIFSYFRDTGVLRCYFDEGFGKSVN